MSDVGARHGMRESERPPARGLAPVAPTRAASPGPLVGPHRGGSPLIGWSANAMVYAQRSVGNAAVARLMAVQRQEVPPTPPPEVSPEDRQKQIYAATATHNVPPLDPTTKRNVEKSMSFAPIYDDIQEKAQLQQSVDRVNRELEDANNQLTIKINNVQSVSGAPGSTAPGGGEPEKASAELEQAKADVARLSAQAQTLADQLKAKQEVVSKELTAIGVKDEAELVTFVEETFPNSFIERGVQIAIAALESNKTAAEKEQERYRTEHGATGDRKGLQDACRDLDNRGKGNRGDSVDEDDGSAARRRRSCRSGGSGTRRDRREGRAEATRSGCQTGRVPTQISDPVQGRPRQGRRGLGRATRRTNQRTGSSSPDEYQRHREQHPGSQPQDLEIEGPRCRHSLADQG